MGDAGIEIGLVLDGGHPLAEIHLRYFLRGINPLGYPGNIPVG
jgi:hypothetical protein